MKKWEIAKQFDTCYGHRVYTQELNTEYSLDNRCVCRHLHGHQGTILVYLRGDELTQGMVTDFKHLNWLKKFIDDVIDHKFIVSINDPNFYQIVSRPSTWAAGATEQFTDDEWPLVTKLIGESTGDFSTQLQYKIIAPAVQFGVAPNIWEHLESFVIVDFVPTSENLSQWIWKIAQEKMAKIGVEVSRVQFFETPKSQANFYSA